MLYLVLCITVCFINSSVGNVYYVMPTSGNQTCPGQVCHDISYYTFPFTFPSNSDITLIFLEGQHILNDLLYIFGVKSVTLKGQGQLTSNDHWSVTQSTAIHCYNLGQLYIFNTTTVYMEGLTYINGDLWLGNYVYHTQYVYIHSVLLKKYKSLYAYTNHINITDSLLDNTNCMTCKGKVYLHLYSEHNTLHNITIQGVTNYDVKVGGALTLLCNDRRPVVFVTDVTITNNNAIGLKIEKCNVIFGNVTISNNDSPLNGGGMWIKSEGSIESKPNTMVSFINNTAKGLGGAIYFDTADTIGNSVF